MKLSTRARTLADDARARMRALDLRTVARVAWHLAASALCVWFAWRVFRVFADEFLHANIIYDESYFVWGGWCITKGLAPYRDFLEFKPPFVFITHALALKLYGYENFGYRHFFSGFAFSSMMALMLAMISRGIDKVLSLSLALGLMYLWLTPIFHDGSIADSESIGLSYYFFGVAALIARTPFPAITNVLGGAFLFACFQSKEPFLPCIGMTWLSCFFLRLPTSDVRADAWRYAKLTGFGAVLVVIGLSAFMIPSGSMKAYLSMMYGYFRFYRDPMQSYCVVLGRFHPTTPLNDLHVQWLQARREFLNVKTLGYLVPFGVVSLAFIPRRSLVLLGMTAFGCVCALWAVTASNCQWLHYYNMTMSGLFFFFVVGLDAMRPHVASWDRYAKMFARFAIFGVVIVHVWGRYEVIDEKYGTRKFLNPYQEPVAGVLQVVSENTMPRDRIFTTGAPLLYVQTNRIGAVRESAIIDEALGYYDGATDEEKLSGLRAQLEKNMPKVVVLDPEFNARRVRHDKALLVPFLTQHHYVNVKPYIWLRPN